MCPTGSEDCRARRNPHLSLENLTLLLLLLHFLPIDRSHVGISPRLGCKTKASIEGVHLLQRPDYDAAARSVAVILAAGDSLNFFPLERHCDGGKSRCADPPALQEKSVIKHKAPLNFLKWKTDAAPTVTWCAGADFC